MRKILDVILTIMVITIFVPFGAMIIEYYGKNIMLVILGGISTIMVMAGLAAVSTFIVVVPRLVVRTILNKVKCHKKPTKYYV